MGIILAGKVLSYFGVGRGGGAVGREMRSGFGKGGNDVKETD